jgi:hypothetical protein
MRPFDLHHHDTNENADWNEVQSLMDRIETGTEGCEVFEIWEPHNGPMIVEVALAAIGKTSAWMVRRESNRKTSYFLARGRSSAQHECVYLGCPELVLECCLLSRADAETGIASFIERQKLQPDWHWVPMSRALARLEGGAAEP